MVRKMILMSESSLKVMNIIADALLARDQIESQNISVNYSYQVDDKIYIRGKEKLELK